MKRMSESEKRIMELIWSFQNSITTKEILSQLPEDLNWKQNTVITFLSRLMEKGILKAERIGKAYYYEPLVTEQEYRSFETNEFIREVHQGSVLGFVSTLCDSGSLTESDIDELMALLKKER